MTHLYHREATIYKIKDIRITPNPASHIVTIRSNFSEDHDLLILSLEGKVIDDIKFSGLSYDHDISQYRSGIYFVKDVDTSEIIKFIKL